MGKAQNVNTRKLVLLALFTGIVVVLQFFGSFIRFGPFAISLVLMPIVVGAALIGVYAGGWLGLAFGFTVLFSPETAFFMSLNAPATVFVILMRGLLAGLAAGAVYKAFEDKNKTAAAVLAAAVCPIVNTGIFIAGLYAFFLPVIAAWGAEAGAVNTASYIFLTLIGANFLLEFALNMTLSAIIVRLVQFGRDKSYLK